MGKTENPQGIVSTDTIQAFIDQISRRNGFTGIHDLLIEARDLQTKRKSGESVDEQFYALQEKKSWLLVQQEKMRRERISRCVAGIKMRYGNAIVTILCPSTAQGLILIQKPNGQKRHVSPFALHPLPTEIPTKKAGKRKKS